MQETKPEAPLSAPIAVDLPLPKGGVKPPPEETETTLRVSEVIPKPPTVPVLEAKSLRLGKALFEKDIKGLSTGFYGEQVVTILRVSDSVLTASQESLTAFYHCASPFWLPAVGVCFTSGQEAWVTAPLPAQPWGVYLTSSAADPWPIRCRLVRDVAVGLYQQRASGATAITWDARLLFVDTAGRAQLFPLVSETPVLETIEVFALGQLLWQVASRSATLVSGWPSGTGLPKECPPEVLALIQACTDPTVSARPSLKTIAKGLDALWKQAESAQNSEEKPAWSRQQSEAEPSLVRATSTLSTASSGSLSLLLIDDQTVGWLSPTDPRYTAGIKLRALRAAMIQAPTPKFPAPALQQAIQTTLLDSSLEVLLWLDQKDADPSEPLRHASRQAWHAPEWEAFRPGELPPTAWLPLLVNLHQPGKDRASPLFTRALDWPKDVPGLTEAEWQVLHSDYALFWLVQGGADLPDPSNLYEANALYRMTGRVKLALHSGSPAAYRLEESTYWMPHDASGRLLPARYQRYGVDPTSDLSAWEGRYRGAIGLETETLTPIPSTAPSAPPKTLNLTREALVWDEQDEKKSLGEGGFGEVIRGTYHRQPVAIKRFKKATLSTQEKAELKDEAAVMANLHSDFLVRLLGLSLDNPPLLVMELAEGNLYHLLKDRSRPLPWPQRYRLLRDISLGLAILHAHELLHGDLKSLNILLDSDGRAKLCDFGFATLKSQVRQDRAMGTVLWNAPELLRGEAASSASDVYSLGMVCWEVASRSLPYGQLKSLKEVMQHVQAGHRETLPLDCPPELAILIQACWSQAPADRPSAGQVVQVLEGLWQEALVAESAPVVLEEKKAHQTEWKRSQPRVYSTRFLAPGVESGMPLVISEPRAVAMGVGSGAPLTASQTQPVKQGVHSGVSLSASQSSLPEQKVNSGVPLTASQTTLPEQGVYSGVPLTASQTPSLGQGVHSGVPLAVSQTPSLKQGMHSGVPLTASQTPSLEQGVHSGVPFTASLATKTRSTAGELVSGVPLLPTEPVLSMPAPTTLSSSPAFQKLLAKSPRPRWQDRLSPQYTLGVKLQRLRQKVLADPFITQELACYVAPNGQSQPGLPSDPLYPWVERELLQGTAQVLVLQGVGGAGKSTFNRHLLRTLWQNPAWQSYRPGDPAPKAPMPVWMPLGSGQVKPDNLWDYYRYLPEIEGLTTAEIAVLKADYQLIWLADGYDEIPGQATPNLYDLNRLDEEKGNVKLIIGCRSQRVQTLSEADALAPHPAGGLPDWTLYRTRHVAPFTSQQTQDYIDKYVAAHQNDPERPKDWDAARYQKEFAAIPELQSLINTPFMLWMTLSILPSLASEQAQSLKKAPKEDKEKDKKDDKETKQSITPKPKITRAALYDRFMDIWFSRQARKAWQQKSFLQDPAAVLGKIQMQTLKIEASQADSEDVQVYWLKAAYRLYGLRLAEQLTQAGKVSLSVGQDRESKQREKGATDWLSPLLGDSPNSQRLRQGCPLRESSDHAWGFMHASILDYFMTTAIVEGLLLKPEEISSGAYALTYAQAVALLAGAHLSHDQANFLIDRVKTNPALQDALFTLIERSKTDNFIAIASANAATVLNACRISFAGKDWRGVQVPGANLSYGVFAHGNFEGANFERAILKQTIWYMAKLNDANLLGVQWGEQPPISLTEWVGAIARHPTQPWIAVGQGKDIILLDWRTGKQVGLPFKAHSEKLRCVAFSSDGRYLASGYYYYETLRLWDVGSRRPLGRSSNRRAKESLVCSVVFSSNGKYLVSNSENFESRGSNSIRTTYVWDVSTGMLKEREELGYFGGKCAAFSPNGKYLAVDSRYEKTIDLWDMMNRRMVRSLKGHSEEIQSVAFSPDGKLIASGSGIGHGESKDNSIRLWDVATGHQVGKSFIGHTDCVNSVAFSPDGKLVVSGSQDNTICLWDVTTGSPFGEPFIGHTGGVSDAVFSLDGQYVISAGDRTIHVWDINPLRLLGESAVGHSQKIICLALSPDGKFIASSSKDKTLRLWDALMECQLYLLKEYEHEMNFMTFSPEGRFLATAARWGRTIDLFDMTKNFSLHESLACDGSVESVVFRSDKKLIILLEPSFNHTILRLWDLAMKTVIDHQIALESTTFKKIAFSPSGTLLLSVDGHILCLFDVNTGREVGKPFSAYSFLSDGIMFPSVCSVAFSPNGQRIVLGGWSGDIRLIDVATRHRIGKPLKGHKGSVECVAFSSNGRYVVSGSSDQTVRLWDISAIYRCVAVLYWSYEICTIALSRFPDQLTLPFNINSDLIESPTDLQTSKEDMLVFGDKMGTISVWKICYHPEPRFQFVSMPPHKAIPLIVDGISLRGCQMDQQSQRLLMHYRADMSKVGTTNDMNYSTSSRVHDSPTPTVTPHAHLIPSDQKHKSKFSFGLKNRLWSPTMSGSSSSSSSSSTMSSTITTSQQTDSIPKPLPQPRPGGRSQLFSSLSVLEKKLPAPPTGATTPPSPALLIEQVYTLLDQACPPKVTQWADLRGNSLKQLAQYKQRNLAGALTATDQRELEELLQTLRDIQAGRSTTVTVASSTSTLSTSASVSSSQFPSFTVPAERKVSVSASPGTASRTTTASSTATLPSSNKPLPPGIPHSQLFTPVKERKMSAMLPTGVTTLLSPALLIEQAYTLLDQACPPKAPQWAALRGNSLKQLAQYKQASLASTLTAADQRALEDLLQTLRDIQAGQSKIVGLSFS